MNVIKPQFLTAGLAGMLLLGSGCHSLMLFQDKPEKHSIAEATRQDPVQEIVCLWETAEGTGLDGLPTRGFAGRIMFFTKDEPQPVLAKGDVRIYVFDDQGTVEEQGRPLHQFDFEDGSFGAFLQDTNLGGAYQVFIPYTRKGNHQANCAIRVRLTTESGQVVWSKMMKITLTGTQETPRLTAISHPEPVEQKVQVASYQEPAPDHQPLTRADFHISESALNGHRTPTADEDRARLRARLQQISERAAEPAMPSSEAPSARRPKPHPLSRYVDRENLPKYVSTTNPLDISAADTNATTSEPASTHPLEGGHPLSAGHPLEEEHPVQRKHPLE